MNAITLELFVGIGPSGRPVREEIRARTLGGGLFEILQSPGLVLGIAAGDVIELHPDDSSKFEIRKRAGNVCIQVFCSTSDELQRQFEQEIGRVGGWLDGRSDKEFVFTVPVVAGFKSIEEALASVISRYPGCEWYYGNVYDPSDGITPLDWWKNV